MALCASQLLISVTTSNLHVAIRTSSFYNQVSIEEKFGIDFELMRQIEIELR